MSSSRRDSLLAAREVRALTDQISVADIERAAERIKPFARRTPLERSRWLSTSEREVLLKLECLQLTGSFKLRGAAAKITSLTDEERRRGILTVSAGNHGLAVAECAERLDLQATIVVPRSASPAKVEAIGRYAAKLVKLGESYDEAEREAREMERRSGLTFVSPYNDPEVIAGQGTTMLEIIEAAGSLDAVVVPVGGGGLIAGVAIAAKALNPAIKVYGVEPEVSPTMTAALKAGRVTEIAEDETIADGLAGNIEPGSITFPIIQRLVDEVVLVSETAIKSGIARLARLDHLIVEGAAAASIAALDAPQLRTGRIAVVVSGRNISLDLFGRIVGDQGPAD
jgi:threonine dehydratase